MIFEKNRETDPVILCQKIFSVNNDANKPANNAWSRMLAEPRSMYAWASPVVANSEAAAIRMTEISAEANFLDIVPPYGEF